MASLRDIRKRIRSVNNSQKITRAMKLVAAAKLRRAQQALMAARPYAQHLQATMGGIVARAAAQAELVDTPVHPLFEQRVGGRLLIAVVTSDRGSCGAFNSNVIRRTQRLVHENREHFAHISLATMGRRGHDHFKKLPELTTVHHVDVFRNLAYARAMQVALEWATQFCAGALDAVVIVGNEFQSAMLQKVMLRGVLPMAPPQASSVSSECVFEPDQKQVLDKIVLQYLATSVWSAWLESAAAEQGARMTAMDAACNNARDLAESLTLQYNRARQAAITGDLMDIVGGAEALSGT